VLVRVFGGWVEGDMGAVGHVCQNRVNGKTHEKRTDMFREPLGGVWLYKE
jgi:hypothetical protein